MRKTKKKPKAVMAWAVVIYGRISPEWIFSDRDAAIHSCMQTEGIARVRITPVAKKRRAR